MNPRLAIILLGAGAPIALADVLNVPADYATIQAAIDAASDGDVVLVAPGVYAEKFSYNAKDIAVRSSGGPLVTTIDGATIPDAMVYVVGGETLDATLEGFTLINGNSSPQTSCAGGFANGGAVYVGSSSELTIIGCRFENNAYDNDTTAGGAVCVHNGSLAVYDSDFIHNGNYDTDEELATAYGGAVYVCNPSYFGSLTIDNCVFDSNGPSAHGGAVWVNTDNSVSITNSDFYDNGASHGGGINCRADSANGDYLIENCTFIGCQSSFGGGINLSVNDAEATVRNCEFIDNAAGFGGGMHAGVSSGGVATLDRLRFDGNLAAQILNVGGFFEACWVDGDMNDYWGAGADLRVSFGGAINLSNVVATGNEAVFGGGLSTSICGDGEFNMSNVTATDNVPSGIHVRLSEEPGFPSANMMAMSGAILWANGEGDDDQLIVEHFEGENTEFAIDHSIVQGGYDGINIIDADPLFTNTYALSAGSPAIDAGNNDAVPDGVTLDLAGNPRFVDDPDTADTGVGPAPVVDMGAYEFQAGDCAADINGDGALNVLDFVAFQLLWQNADPAADCDDNAAFNILDFVCFQQLFQAGCP